MNKIMLTVILLVAGSSFVSEPDRTAAKVINIAETNVSYIQGASITYKTKSETITIQFSDKELEQIKDDPSVLETKLGAKVKCCGPRKKISNCIWECCDGDQVKVGACNQTLVTALEEIWGT
jgi:hypothetical protein